MNALKGFASDPEGDPRERAAGGGREGIGAVKVGTLLSRCGHVRRGDLSYFAARGSSYACCFRCLIGEDKKEGREEDGYG